MSPFYAARITPSLELVRKRVESNMFSCLIDLSNCCRLLCRTCIKPVEPLFLGSIDHVSRQDDRLNVVFIQELCVAHHVCLCMMDTAYRDDPHALMAYLVTIVSHAYYIDMV